MAIHEGDRRVDENGEECRVTAAGEKVPFPKQRDTTIREVRDAEGTYDQTNRSVPYRSGMPERGERVAPGSMVAPISIPPPAPVLAPAPAPVSAPRQPSARRRRPANAATARATISQPLVPVVPPPALSNTDEGRRATDARAQGVYCQQCYRSLLRDPYQVCTGTGNCDDCEDDTCIWPDQGFFPMILNALNLRDIYVFWLGNNPHFNHATLNTCMDADGSLSAQTTWPYNTPTEFVDLYRAIHQLRTWNA